MWPSFPSSWWQRLYPASLPHLHVVLYTRQDCHLCADAWQLLQAARQRYGFSLDRVDVDLDPALAARFGEQVPVAAVDGKVHFWGRINPVLFERLLRAEARRTSRDREGA